MVKKWSIYWASLDPIVGSEQAGTRPVLVISNNIVNEVLPIVTVIPLSSLKDNGNIYPTEIFLSMEKCKLPKDSVAMVHQIRTISKDRLSGICGSINDKGSKQNINTVLKEYFEP